jgi:DNA-binding response OmpR family regulator
LSYRILMVEDDSRYMKLVSDYFRKNGFCVTCAENGDKALALFAKEDFDAVLLDVMMPGVDGFYVCKRLRETSNVPVLFVTARGDLSDTEYGFRLGADDYIVKPYSERVLLLKVQALIDRAQGALVSGSKIESCGIHLDKETHRATVDGAEIQLTPKLFAMLLLLMEHKGKVLSREQLLDHVWGYDFFGDARVVDTHIAKLRKALGKCEDHIETIPKLGYKFEE